MNALIAARAVAGMGGGGSVHSNLFLSSNFYSGLAQDLIFA